MTEKDFFTLKMKLDRQKISYSINETENKLILGKANFSLTYILLRIVLPFLISLFFFVLMFAFGVSKIPILRGIIPAIPLMFGVFGIVQMKRKKKGNSGAKIIQPNLITIAREGEEGIQFSADDIEKIAYQVKIAEEGQDVHEGLIFVKGKNGSEYQLLSIWDRQKKFIDSDVKYLSTFIHDIVMEK